MRLKVVALTAILFSLATIARGDEPFGYKGFVPSATTFEQWKASTGDPRNKESAANGTGQVVFCDVKGPGLKMCSDNGAHYIQWYFVDGVLSYVYAPIPRSDFPDVVNLFQEKYGKSFVVAEENIADELGHQLNGYHTYTWTRAGKKIVLSELSDGSLKTSGIEVVDVDLNAAWNRRVKHVSI